MNEMNREIKSVFVIYLAPVSLQTSMRVSWEEQRNKNADDLFSLAG
jgi:hypothetical protein